MTKWHMLAELLSLFFMLLMFLYYYEKNAVLSFRRRAFNWIFGFSISSVILDLICVHTIGNFSQLPSWLNFILNTAYFILIVLVCSMIALYLFDLMLEHVYDKKCYKRYVFGLVILNTGFLCAALSNVYTKVLFYFSPEGRYVRGPLNRLGYGIMAAELVMVLTCYWRNRAAVPPKVVRVIRTLPPIAAVLTCFQIAYPQILLNGTITAVAILILYSNFQTCQIERDYLTHLGNRKSFLNDISAKIESGQAFQIVSVSLKRFNEINENYDHAFGDALLFTVGKWLGEVSAEGSAYRVSNVSFAAVFPYYDDGQAEKNAENIYERFEGTWRCKGAICRLTACTCDLIWYGQACTPKLIMEYLETMPEMGRLEGSEWIRFNERVAARIRRVKHLEAILRSSIKEDRFTIVLQPLYDCKNKGFSCGEALVRLKDYDGTPVPAGEFIPIAERMGLIDEISWAVFEKVCRFLSSHRDLPLESISVNFSMQQFVDPRLLENIENCMKKYKIPFDRIKIEITERVIIQDLDFVKQIMGKMNEKGLGFYLDDFGSGYSNIAVLMQLPFEYVKLDKSVLNYSLDEENVRKAAYHMLSFFHNIGFKVVCEGIETEKQAKTITELGADFIQGFYYARPMEEEAFADFISRRSVQPK